MLRLLVIILALLSTELHAAVVVEDTNLSWGPDNAPGIPGVPNANYRGTLFQNAGASDFTSAWFYYSGSSIRANNVNLDEGSDWYVVSAGQVFTKQTIQQGLAAPLLTFGPVFYPAVALPAGQDFYLGVVTGQGFGPNDRDVFGWVRLRPSGSTLTMIDNAISYDSEGIIVGTSIVVPEPNSFYFVLFSAVLISFTSVRRLAVKNPGIST